MIVDLNITEYIRSLMKEEKNDLSHIESEARVNHVPIVKPETKELLRTLVLLKKPMKILEVGAAVGFSSLYMNSYQPEGGTIITIERNEKRIKKAKENIKNQGKEEQIIFISLMIKFSFNKPKVCWFQITYFKTETLPDHVMRSSEETAPFINE